MQSLIKIIAQLVAEKEPAPGRETIILINGFEDLKFYAELAVTLEQQYKSSDLTYEIRLARKKWNILKSGADTTTIQTMKQNNWIAEKESVTFYRNQHKNDVLILMGTEEEDDTGGLLNCFTITPEKITEWLNGEYHRLFESCFDYELSDDEKKTIDCAYKSLFEHIPTDICKLSAVSSAWFKQFSNIDEFCEAFSNDLVQWGLPNKEIKAYTPKEIKKPKSILRDEYEFISGKIFSKISGRAYAGLEKKLDKYPDNGLYWEDKHYIKAGFAGGYKELAEVLLSFARGEKVAENRKKLLHVDYTIINDILKFKTGTGTSGRVKEISVKGQPIEVILGTALKMLRFAKANELENLSEICFSFRSASIVTGYTDTDGEDKYAELYEAWKNICIHTNGIFEYINRNSWRLFGNEIKITCAQPGFFNPGFTPEETLGKIVNTSTGTNTLSKISFYVEVYDSNGNIIRYDTSDDDKELRVDYVWKFDNEAGWLYDFRDIAKDSEIINSVEGRIPTGVMGRIREIMVVKSEEEFFDEYEENLPDLSFDMQKYVSDRTFVVGADTETVALGMQFAKVGKAFCGFVQELASKGFYKCLENNLASDYINHYNKLSELLLKHSFAEDQLWMIDAYMQSFVIQQSNDLIDNEEDSKCVIIPPWHPAALQKIIDQKSFIVDGLAQKVSDFDAGIIKQLNVDDIMDHLVYMTEIQSSIDVFPGSGNDFMGVVGSYGDFCVYGDIKSIGEIKTRMKDLIRKEAIYDDEFKTSDFAKINDDAKMFYGILEDYNKAMPSVKSTLSIAFINPPDLQPIISAVSLYVKRLQNENSEELINIKLSILVRPENKGGKNYLTYWMNDYFAGENETKIRIYLNEWSSYSDLDKILSDNNDIVFNMDLIHDEHFTFKANTGDEKKKISDCRFPIVYKPSPLSKTSKKRRVELTQTQFSVSFKHAQVARYKKQNDTVPIGTYLAVRESSIDQDTKKVIDMLHRKAYWVVCIDKVMDGALLRTNTKDNQYAIIGFSTGKGMYGQYNLTITARNSILETVEKKLRDKLYRLFLWEDEVLNVAVKNLMDEARGLDGISMLSAINPKGTNIHEFLAYTLTALREKQMGAKSALKVIIHLDSYRHWFNNNELEASSSRPDFLMLSVQQYEPTLKLSAKIIECKTASINNYSKHVETAINQVNHGLEQLQRLFDPESLSIERRYWYAQLYRALVFAQVTFADNSAEFEKITSALRAILDGNFEIEWSGDVIGYWVDKHGAEETVETNGNVVIHNVPQEKIQKILLNSEAAKYVELEVDVIDMIDDIKDEELDKEAEEQRKQEKKNIYDRGNKRHAERSRTGIPTESEGKTPLDAVVPDNPSGTGQEKETGSTPVITPKDGSSQEDTVGSGISETDGKHDFEEIPATESKSLQDIRILVGKDKSGAEVYWEFGNKWLSNRHLLITGRSGQGKTYCIQTMLYEASKSNISMVVFDYTEGFRPEQLEKKFKEKMDGHTDNKVIKIVGVPINPFKRYDIEVAGMQAQEEASDVAQRVASTLKHVYDFGDQQFAAIYEACYKGVEKYGNKMSMKLLLDELNDSSNKSASSVVSKMTPFTHSVKFSEQQCDWEDILYNKTGKLTIFQLTGFVREVQVIITEFMLWDMWHFAKTHGNKDKPFVVVLDEAQNLSHAESSPSGLILTEGRKFGWSAWYATQSLKILNDDEVTRLMQAAFSFHFKPAETEVTRMAKQLDPMDANKWKTPLLGLKKGECIVVGDRIQKDGEFKAGRPTVTKITAFEER